MNTKSLIALTRSSLAASMLLLSGLAGAAIVNVNLTAQRMSATLPDGASVPMWGYCTTPTPTPGPCLGPWAPGPTIVAAPGDTLNITLTNSLPVSTSMVILGQLGGGMGTPARMVSPTHAPQNSTTWPGNGAPAVAFTPPAQGQRVTSFATEVAPSPTATTLTWSNLKPGTYLYETGTLPSIQAPMGLYGVLIVTQAPLSGATGQAYPGKSNVVAYDYDTSLLFSEIDPVQNNAVDAAAVAGADVKKRFDDPSCAPACYPAAVNYRPTYFLINGQAFDKTAPQKSAFAVAGDSVSPGIHTANGNVLVRLLNAGLRTHVPTIVGLPMAIVAEDGNVAPGNPKVQNEVLLTAGKTHDVLVTPASNNGQGFAGTYSTASLPLFDRQLSLTTGNTPDGGMQGFLQVAQVAGRGLPTAVTPTAVNDSFQVPLNASINGNVKTNDIAVAAVALVAGPSNGTLVSFNADGTFVYTPNSGYSGPDSFTYNGNGGTTNTATVTLNVGSAGTGAAPTAVADAYTSTVAAKFSAARPGVLANDSDPGGYPLTAVLATTGNCGAVSMSADGSFSAAKGAGSACTFTYVAKNSQGTSSAPANVTVTFVPTGMATGLNVAVFDPATNVPITDYRWIIQEDLTFKVDPTGTPSVSTRTLGTSFHRSHMNVVATGCVGPISCGKDQQIRTDDSTVDANGTLGARHVVTEAEALALQTMPDQAVLDPTKNYYISILPGDAGSGGHGMGGAEIKPGMVSSAAQVKIAANAYDWVPAQLSIYIYEDNAPINGQNDLNETGLGGFNIILMDAVGRSGDVAGQQSYDSYGMPLSNALLGRAGCPDDQNVNTNGTATSATGNKVGLVYTCPNAPDRGPAPVRASYATQADFVAALAAYQALLAQDAIDYVLAGHALIMNVTPARYDVIAHPAAARQGAGEVWWQTETLEGTAAQDGFAGVKEPVYFQEFGPPGFHTTIGFVNPDRVKRFAIDNAVTGNNTITGKITNQRMSHPSDVSLWDSGSYDLLSSTTCQVALNSQGGDGPAIAITQCNPDGSFTLTNVPAGSYELMVWDQWLDQIIQAVAVTVPEGGNQTVAMGNLPVLSWFTQYDQNIFIDANKNGVYDSGEKGIANVTMTTRYRDGGISNQTATDSNGNGLLAELFPLFNWYVTEADTTRFKQTGVNVIVDGGGQVDLPGDANGGAIYSSKYATGESSNRVELPGAYSYGMQGFISQRNTINWGRTPYVANENGGIQGVVVYSTTRPFDDQRYNVQTLWEPLVPRVTVNLYRKEKLSDGTDALTKVDTVLTSSFDDWVNTVYGANGIDKYILGPDQVLRDPVTGAVAPGTDVSSGAPKPPVPASGAYPPGKQVNLQCPGQLASDVFSQYTLGTNDIKRCYDGWHNWNQVQAAPYDGRYQFPSAAYATAHPLTSAQIAAGQTLVSLPPGNYVVESVTPAGFEVVKEEDKNILNGDTFVAPAATQFGGLGNIFILPDQATLNNANPYNLKNADGIASNATSNLGATASQAQFPECVGSPHRVPDYLSLFPAGGLVAPFGGMDRPLCDRKLVTLADQMQASANFFVFTQVPMAANGTGIILDDATSEFNAIAPDFGEKASVPFVPVSVKDFNGREISRLYSDQWGAFNMLTPSSWLVNPPTPSGYGPNMLVTCMNDPGPILDPATRKMVTDPQYNPAYSNFCYTLPFMPGRTTYLDTPVLPIAAFAAGYTPADCEYPDATPAIARVDSSDGFGPYVSAAGKTLTITALGDRTIPNPAYAGPFALTGPASQRTITRHYGFGAQGTHGTVTVNGVAQSVTGWTDTTITVTVPAGTTTGQLVVTADNGVSSIDTVTVTVEANAPTRVQGANGGTIQAAVNAATPGDLILVDAGTYNELVIMWKPVRLQGVGAASVIINAAKYPTRKLEDWRPEINSLFSVDITTGNQTGIAQVDPLPTQEITGGVVLLEPSVLGTEQGPGITVLAKNLAANQCSGGDTSTYGNHKVTESNFLCAASRIDGVSVTGGDSGGGIFVNGWAHNLEISNNRVYGNAGALNGGVRIGVPYLELESYPVDAGGNILMSGGKIAGFGYDTNVKIHHNAITKNGTVESTAGAGGAGGGVSICTGTDGYSVDHNWICGNYSASDGGGIGHIGFSQNGSIANNQILFNQSFQQSSSTHGGGVMVMGEPPVAGTVSLGAGDVTIDANLIRGNFAEGGHGGGVRLQQVNGADVTASNQPARWHKVTLTNNMVVNNVAGWAGGGIALSDTLRAFIDNNTVSSNDSTGIAGVVLAGGVGLPAETPGQAGVGKPSPSGIVTEPTSVALLAQLPTSGLKTANAISQPELINNIIWQNRSFFYDGTGRLCVGNNLTDVAPTCSVLPDQATTGQCVSGAKYWEIGVLGDTSTTPGAQRLNPTYAVMSSIAGYAGTGNKNANPALVDAYCNGSRVTPEFQSVINPPSVKNLQVAATVDEGNNYVNLRYGPLYSSKPTDSTGGAYVAFGNYHITPGSPAKEAGTTLPAVTHDFDGDVRPQGAAYDIGADELALVRITPTSLAFGNRQVGTTSAVQTVTVTNVGSAALPITSITISGANADNFAQSNGCGSSLAGNASCTITVTFTPLIPALSAGTPKAATLNVNDTAGTQTVALSGTAIPPLGSLAPASLAFGNQQVNVASAPQVITLTNTGIGPLTISSVALSGANAAQYAQTNTCASPLAPNTTCTINVTFTPTSIGSKAGVTVAVTGANGAIFTPASVSLSGTGVPPSGSLAPASLAFGNQQVNVASAPQVITLTNTGIGPLTISSVALGGANAAQYAQTNTCGTNVPVGGNCTISVTFTPTTTGSKGGVTVAVTGANGALFAPASVSLSGTGANPASTRSPTSLAFGNQPDRTTSASLAVTLNNTGTVPLLIQPFTFTGTNATDFAQTNTCGTSVAVGANCTINVTFTPGATGNRSGTLQLSYTGGSQAVALTGTGTAPPLTPNPLAFGNEQVDTSVTQPLTLTNNEGVALAITSITITGSANFTQTNTCGASVAPGASCTINVTFTPSAAVSRTATLTVNDGVGAQTASLTGTGTTTTGTLTALAFGNQLNNTTSAAKVSTFTYTGAGSIKLASDAVAIAGTNPGQFALTTNTCNGATLSTGSTCTISVTFTPTSSGTKNATLTVGTDSATLTGTGGTAASQSVTPTGTLAFGTVARGSSSAVQTVTVTNTGFTAIPVTSITFTTDPTYWTQTNTCGSSIQANGSCTISVRFTPPLAGTAGAHNSTLSIVDGIATTTRSVTGTAS